MLPWFSLAPQRAQGALVMSSVKSHPGYAGKHKEQQSGGVLPAFSGCWARGVPGDERGTVVCGVGVGTGQGGRVCLAGLLGGRALEHRCLLKQPLAILAKG